MRTAAARSFGTGADLSLQTGAADLLRQATTSGLPNRSTGTRSFETGADLSL